jgi:hypothetical protein
VAYAESGNRDRGAIGNVRNSGLRGSDYLVHTGLFGELTVFNGDRICVVRFGFVPVSAP